MKKYIAEDLPARSHPQAQLSNQSNKPSEQSGGGGDRDKKDDSDKTPEQKIRQAVYDIRYRARRENLPLRTAYSQYMQNSSMSEMEKSQVRQKLFDKEGGGGGVQAEDFDMRSEASDLMAKALYRVFVDKQPKLTQEGIQTIKRQFLEASETAEGKKYKVRVKDPQNDVTYVRYATRQKISQLRGKGLEVEMTEYGDPYEGEKKKGEQTAEVSRNKSKASRDFDGDGKIESGAKEHAGVVHNAIQRKKGLPADGKDTSNVKEAFMGEVLGMANLPVVDSDQYINPDTNSQQIDVLPPNKKNKVTVNPSNTVMAHTELKGDLINENGYKKFLGILQEKKMTKAKKEKEKKLKNKYDTSGMKQNMQQQYGSEKGKKVYFATIRKQAMKEESETTEKKSKGESSCGDSRSIPTAISLLKSKGQSMGIKNPIVMAASYEPEGEQIDERRSEDRGKPRKTPDPAFMFVRNQNKEGLVTKRGGRSGKQTVAQHERSRGVKKDRTGPVTPDRPTTTPAEKVSRRRSETERRKKQSQEMQSSRFD